jgi:predicted nicotinamide N-methyase
MPYSSGEGKAWLAAQIWAALREAPERTDEETGHVFAPRVLDIGAGSGTYADLLSPGRHVRDRGYLHITAIEIHIPYVSRFNLRSKYDDIIMGDARVTALPKSDVVILGDVLEHMPLPDAVALWQRAREAATTAVFASLPIVEYPQGESEGNPHEAHVHTWSHDLVLAELAGITEWWAGPQIGVYRAGPACLA